MKKRSSLYKQLVSTCLLGIATLSTAVAQQEAMFSQYMFNTLSLNPAYAGNRDVLSLTTMGRYQWIGVEGSPKTWSLTVDTPLKNERMGLGLTAFTDGLGLQENVGMNLVYSYKVKLSETTTLSLGVNGGVQKIGWNLSDAKNIESNDQVFSSMNNINRFFPNVGTGLYISNDRGYIGVSVPQIITHKLNPFSTETANRTSTARMHRHYYTMMGFVMGKGSIKVKPSTMIRYTPGSGIGVDGNVNVWFNDKIAVGVSGRKSQMAMAGVDFMDAAIGMLELQLTPQLRFGVAYDMNLNRLNSSSKTGGKSKFLGTPTYEGMLRYEFGYGKNKIITPRYF